MKDYENWQKDFAEYKEKGKIWGAIDPDRIAKFKFPRIEKEIIDKFLSFDDVVSTVSDIMDTMGLRGAVGACRIKPVFPGRKIAGTAVTLRHIPERVTCTQGYVVKRDGIRLATMDTYFLAEPGDIIVVDAGGSEDFSNIGGMSCTVAKACGMGGTIVDGCIRDLDTIRKLDYPIWAKGYTPITSKNRIEAIEINGPATIGNVQVLPGDFIIADETGVVVIPPDKIQPILAELIRMTEMEDVVTSLANSHGSLDEIRAAHRRRLK